MILNYYDNVGKYNVGRFYLTQKRRFRKINFMNLRLLKEAVNFGPMVGGGGVNLDPLSTSGNIVSPGLISEEGIFGL